MAEPRTRFPWGLTVVCAIAFALLCSLGVWQVQRLQWKERLIAEAEAAAAAPPMDLRGLATGGGGEFRSVRLTCAGLDTAPYVELQSIKDGQPGVRLTSLCRTETYSFGGESHARRYLIDRGFVSDAISARPPQRRSDKPVQVVAQVRSLSPPNGMAPPPAGRRFYARDVKAMAAVLLADQPPQGYPDTIAGLDERWMLFATTSTNPEWLALKPSAPPAAFSNNHLGYAFTWFGLALALAATYVALLRRKLKS